MTDPLVCIKTYADEPSAHIGRSILESHGIRTAIRSDGASGFEPWLAYARGYQLVVREHDAVAAGALLEEEG
ncbi:MAG TPA: DUF2007 domain-containing protein [Gemmatimonadales bacterium]|nr:DUF2007 domain-containing protein [Gemmatimonadales bacterium]